jgi:uncharacterized protein YhaN
METWNLDTNAVAVEEVEEEGGYQRCEQKIENKKFRMNCWCRTWENAINSSWIKGLRIVNDKWVMQFFNFYESMLYEIESYSLFLF